MHTVETHEMTPAFYEIWCAAGQHLNSQVEGGIRSWLRAHVSPPILEHLSFRLGNQLFFIHVYDVNDDVAGPGSLKGLQRIVESCQGHACLMPMYRDNRSSLWRPYLKGWGLIHPATQDSINPISLITDKLIEMTDWELQDFAVQVVKQKIEKDGYELMSFCTDPEVNPSLWFVGASGRPEWVVVKSARYPVKRASRPSNMREIAASVGQAGAGHFASVVVVNSEDSFDPMAAETGNFTPLFRGAQLIVNFSGLEPAIVS